MKILLVIASITFCAAASAYLEHEDRDAQAAQYCEMTSIWQTTHGASGWPPYLGVACKVVNHE